MRPSTQKMQKIERKDVTDVGLWSCAYHVDQNFAEFSRLLHILTVQPRDIYTSRLPHTVNLFGAMQGGRVEMLKRNSINVDFTDVLHVLSIVLTHSRMARTRAAKPVDPAFFVKDREGNLRIAMPLPHLVKISGLDDEDLSAILSPLVQDKALRILNGKDGGRAVLVSGGFVDDMAARRFFRF